MAFALAAEQGQVACQGPREGGFAAAVAADERPAFTRRHAQVVYFKVFVSLRRNVPCEICNDDMMYPIFAAMCIRDTTSGA